MAVTARDLLFRLGYEVDKASESGVENSVNSIKKMVSRVLGVMGVSLSISGLKNLVQAAADVEALNSQFSQVFGEVEQDASAALESIASETGVVAGRLKGSFTQIAAFAKTTGVDAQGALEITSRATQVAADSAAFYDREIEQVTASLQSFLKGNYENDAALGLSCTETTRNAAANDLYGKSFKDLSEAEKQLTLLKMVEDANEASGALGQAARESDTWTNQLGNLKQAVLELKQKVGGVFLQPAIAIIKTLSTVVQKATQGFQSMTDKLGGTQTILKLIGIVAASVFGVIALGKALKFIDALRQMDKAMLGAKLKMLALVAVFILIGLLVDDFLAFMRGDDSVIGLIFERAGIDAEKARETIQGAWKAVTSFLRGAWNTIKTVAVTVFGSLSAWWAENGEGIKSTFSRIWQSVTRIASALWRALSSVAKTIFNGLSTFWDTWGGTITTAFSTIWNTLVALIQPLSDALAALIDFVANVFTGDWQGAWESIQELASSVWEALVTIVTGAWDTITGVWDSVVEYFTGIFQNVYDGVSQKVGEVYDSIVDGINAAVEWIKGLPAEAVQWGSDIIQGIVDGIKGAISWVGDAISGVAQSIRNFIGFSEPEEGPLSDFHTYMPDMMQLMSKGILEGRSVVKGAIEDLTGGVSDQLTSKGMAGAFRLAGAASPTNGTVSTITGSNNSTRTITQNVNINQAFNGNAATQRNIARAAGSAAEDTTGALARALAFAR